MITTNSFIHTSIELSEVKSFVRVDTDAHDTLLSTLVEAAQDECFNRTHFVFGSAEFTVKRWEVLSQLALPFAPVLSVTEVLLDGEAAVLDTDYEVKGDLVCILTGYSDTIELTFTCGTTLPADVKHAIFQRVKYGYDFGDDLPQNLQAPRFFDRVTDRYRHYNTYAG